MKSMGWEGNGLNLLFSNFAVLFGIHLLFAKWDCNNLVSFFRNNPEKRTMSVLCLAILCFLFQYCIIRINLSSCNLR